MRVAIHQPTLFPWIGLFHKIRQADCFVFFDHLPLPRGKSWITRNKLHFDNQTRWFTIPIYRKGRSTQLISQTEINYSRNFIRKHLAILRYTFSKCLAFEDVYPMFEYLYFQQFDNLCEFNTTYCQMVCTQLGIHPKFISSMDMLQDNKQLLNLKGNDLILNICQNLGASAYISGSGCLDFIDPVPFEEKNIEFYFQDFQYKTYKQMNSHRFISHLSSVDTFFNLGFDGAKELIAENMLYRAIEISTDIEKLRLFLNSKI